MSDLITIISNAPTGYRCAGLSLQRGSQTLLVSKEQHKALEADPMVTAPALERPVAKQPIKGRSKAKTEAQ